MESPLPNNVNNWLPHPKSHYIHQALRSEALSHLQPLTDQRDITIYTDSSVDPATAAASAAFVCEGFTR